jgi:hypothetical protein
MKRNMFFRIGVCSLATLLTLSCSISEPQPEPSVEPSIEPYIPPVTDVSPTNTPLPPLPDFDQLLWFGGAGGGYAWTCPDFFSYTGPSPAAQGGLSFASTNANSMAFQNLPRLAYLCLWGFPADKPFKVSLISPDGSHSLNGDFSVSVDSTGDQILIWDNREAEDSYMTNPGNGLAAEIDFWWPGNLQGGIWKIDVTWQGGSITGDFDAGDKSLPEISLEDPGVEGQVLPVCHSVASRSDFFAIGESFPVNSQAYILLYEPFPLFQKGMDRNYQLVWKDSVITDGNGSFRSRLSYDIEPGVTYQLIAVTDSNISISHQLFSDTIGAVDCFSVPKISTALSCPGAPPQRMTVNQRGYACTRSDPVRVRVSPARSATTLVQIEPGTQFTVIGGPSCSDDWSWWNVRLDDGTIGWVAEGGDEVDSYFICP